MISVEGSPVEVERWIWVGESSCVAETGVTDCTKSKKSEKKDRKMVLFVATFSPREMLMEYQSFLFSWRSIPFGL